jgi:hypothetical protein
LFLFAYISLFQYNNIIIRIKKIKQFYITINNKNKLN